MEIKKYKTLFDTDGKPYIIDKDGGIVATSEQIGMVYNEGPPHDHNTKWGSKFLEDLYIPNFYEKMEKMGGYVYLIVHEICPLHIDCGCKSGFILVPMLFNGMVIMDLYGLLEKEEVYIHE